MMLNLGKESEESEQKLLSAKMWIGPAILIMILLIEFIVLLSMTPTQNLFENNISPAEVGVALFTKYVLGVELTAMLLMAGIVGAYHIGRRKKKVLHRFLEEEGND